MNEISTYLFLLFIIHEKLVINLPMMKFVNLQLYENRTHLHIATTKINLKQTFIHVILDFITMNSHHHFLLDLF